MAVGVLFAVAARWSLVLLSRCFDWKNALVIVKPETLIGWHRRGFRLFWRWKSRPGRPPLFPEIGALIVPHGRPESDLHTPLLERSRYVHFDETSLTLKKTFRVF